MFFGKPLILMDKSKLYTMELGISERDRDHHGGRSKKEVEVEVVELSSPRENFPLVADTHYFLYVCFCVHACACFACMIQHLNDEKRASLLFLLSSSSCSFFLFS